MKNLEVNANYIKVENVIDEFLVNANDTSDISKDLLSVFFKEKDLLGYCIFNNDKFYNVIGTDYIFADVRKFNDISEIKFDKFIYNNVSPFLKFIKLAYSDNDIYDHRFDGFYRHTHKKLKTKQQKFFNELITLFATYSEDDVLSFIEPFYFNVIFKERLEFQLKYNNKHCYEKELKKQNDIKTKYFNNTDNSNNLLPRISTL